MKTSTHDEKRTESVRVLTFSLEVDEAAALLAELRQLEVYRATVADIDAGLGPETMTPLTSTVRAKLAGFVPKAGK